MTTMLRLDVPEGVPPDVALVASSAPHALAVLSAAVDLRLSAAQWTSLGAAVVALSRGAPVAVLVLHVRGPACAAALRAAPRPLARACLALLDGATPPALELELRALGCRIARWPCDADALRRLLVEARGGPGPLDQPAFGPDSASARR